MTLVSKLAAAARTLFRTNRVEHDLDAELREYAELVAAEKIRDHHSPDDARRAALIEVGGIEEVKEEVRDARAGATLALALGIGANTAILSVVNGVLLRPLPYRDSDRLVVILHKDRNPVAPANVVDWRRQTHSFTAVAAAEYWSANLSGADQPEHVLGLRLSAGMFPLLGVSPLLGRVFTAQEDVPGNDRVAVISYGLWQRRFGGDRGVIGRRVSFDGDPFTIVGVMPASFQFAPFWATHA